MVDTGFIDDFSSTVNDFILKHEIPNDPIIRCCENTNLSIQDIKRSTKDILPVDFESTTLFKSDPNSKLNQDIDINLKQSFNIHRGTLYMRIGPMFSGKTTWLNGELTELADQGFSVLKITHSDDIRNDVASCDDGGSTHNSSYRSLSNKITRIRTSRLSDINVTDFHVIGVDESQFFTVDLLTTIEDWVENQGKHVRVVGLDGDAFKRKFGQTLDLIPICDEVIKLSARCRICLDELERLKFRGNIMGIAGPFTKRLGTSTAQKDVGGSDKYIPVCRYHHSS